MSLNRRQLIQGSTALAFGTAAPLLWAADTLKIGFVSPQTGPLAPFGEADKWVIEQMKSAFKDGLTIAGRKFDVQIVLKDSQSNPNRAGDAVAATNLATVVGPVKWGGQGPFKNVSKTPLVLGQWNKGTKHKVELTIVNHDAARDIPTGGTLQLL